MDVVLEASTLCGTTYVEDQYARLQYSKHVRDIYEDDDLQISDRLLEELKTLKQVLSSSRHNIRPYTFAEICEKVLDVLEDTESLFHVSRGRLHFVEQEYSKFGRVLDVLMGAVFAISIENPAVKIEAVCSNFAAILYKRWAIHF